MHFGNDNSNFFIGLEKPYGRAYIVGGQCRITRFVQSSLNLFKAIRIVVYDNDLGQRKAFR